MSAKANVMVMLVEHGWAMQVEVAREFSCDVRTVRRAQERYDQGGSAAWAGPMATARVGAVTEFAITRSRS